MRLITLNLSQKINLCKLDIVGSVVDLLICVSHFASTVEIENYYGLKAFEFSDLHDH